MVKQFESNIFASTQNSSGKKKIIFSLILPLQMSEHHKGMSLK